MKQPDRLAITEVLHEDVDNHQIEAEMIESGQAGSAAVRKLDAEPVIPQPALSGPADMRIVVDDQNTAHHGPLPSRFPVSRRADVELSAANHCVLSYFCRKFESCLPCTVYKAATQPISLRRPATRLWFVGIGLRRRAIDDVHPRLLQDIHAPS